MEEGMRVTVNGKAYLPAIPESASQKHRRIAEAMARSMQIEIEYVDLKGVRSVRFIEPYEYAWKTNKLAILAWCHKREGIRMFYVDRIEVVWGTLLMYKNVATGKEG